MAPHLKLVLLAAEVGALLLPECVRLDDVRRVDRTSEMVLQHLKSKYGYIVSYLINFKCLSEFPGGEEEDGGRVDLEDGLDCAPAGVAAHVDDHGEAQLPNILAANRPSVPDRIHYL